MKNIMINKKSLVPQLVQGHNNIYPVPELAEGHKKAIPLPAALSFQLKAREKGIASPYPSASSGTDEMHTVQQTQ